MFYVAYGHLVTLLHLVVFLVIRHWFNLDEGCVVQVHPVVDEGVWVEEDDKVVGTVADLLREVSITIAHKHMVGVWRSTHRGVALVASRNSLVTIVHIVHAHTSLVQS